MKKSLFALMAIAVLVSFACAGAGETEAKADKKMRPALLVIDIQNEFLPDMAEQNRQAALDLINSAIRVFRENGFPVIRVYHTNPKWGPKPDSPGFQFPASINVKADDPQIIKNYGNAFNKTGLAKLLHEKGCNTLFLCGLSATGCVLATYNGAEDLDFDVYMLKDALLSPNAAYTNVILDISNSVNFHTMRIMLENAQKY